MFSFVLINAFLGLFELVHILVSFNDMMYAKVILLNCIN